MEFLHVDSLEAAQEKLLAHAKDWLLKTETLALSCSLGRILSEDIVTQENIPHFRRSFVDGYAVVSADTATAGDNAPVFLTVKGSVEMGQPASFSVLDGECAEIFTGSMIPEGADAAAMVEYSETHGENKIALYKGVSNGENIVQIGEDIKAGEILLKAGRRILPQDIGTLAAAGITSISVYAPVKITIISTGDELVTSEIQPKSGQIRDVNTYVLTALAKKRGFEIANVAVLPDNMKSLEEAVCKGMSDSDIVLISGGSSKGKMDLTREVFERVSEPGVFTHGLAMKPGKPTILGVDRLSKTLLVGLPGHPAAAMLVFEVLLGWLFGKLAGLPPAFQIPAKVSCNIASASGRQSCWLVKLSWTEFGYIADPIFGKSGLISTLSLADGYFFVNRDIEGLTAGEKVMVNLLN